MNKQVGGKVNDRKAKLESELMGNEMDQMQMDVETGHAAPVENQRKMKPYIDRNRHFQMKQGLRRKHPERVLHQFHGIAKTQSNAKEQWQKAMLHETKRAEMPHDFVVKDQDLGMTNQMGVATISAKNYKDSKEKLMRMHLVGV